MCFRNKLVLIPLYDIGNQLGSRYFIITRSSYTVNYASKNLRGGVLLSLNLKSENSFLKRGGCYLIIFSFDGKIDIFIFENPKIHAEFAIFPWGALPPQTPRM